MSDSSELLSGEPIDFQLQDYRSGRIRFVLFITLLIFFGELVGGWLTGSMALTADAWHMLTHAMSFAINLIGYALVKRFSGDPRLPQGVHKINSLAGYTSAFILAMVAFWIGYESFLHLLTPAPIDYRKALIVSVLGLVVNLICAWILSREPQRHAAHDHAHHSHEPDHNYRSAILHVAADAFTSLLAIFALSAGLLWGWQFFDAVIGLFGATVILIWSYGLLKGSVLELLGYVKPRATSDPKNRQANPK